MSRSTVKGGNTRITSLNTDWFSHGGHEDRTYENGELIDIVHHTPDGKSHSHEVCHGIFGAYKGEVKK